MSFMENERLSTWSLNATTMIANIAFSVWAKGFSMTTEASVGSPVVDRRVTTKRSWGQIGDVETADEGTIHHHSYGDNSSDKHHYSSKRAKTITHLSDELNFVLSQQWSSNVMDRIQEHHAMSQHALEKDWSPNSTPGFGLVQVSSVLGNQL
ncbi:hypothetical protein C7212DRAFT_342228 [Tuber magnatum]|uniref:Uncharacterized protein n=1 Tax=Tuber magnatum TaxID=42249 RepID=A0A317SVY0_9PEZI|nr:hypothetical protein C7212DRAFT_342228 [Tuber magnatum]